MTSPSAKSSLYPVLRLASVIAVTGWAPGLSAQGVTTAGIRGTVRGADGSHLEDARVAVRHAATGYSTETRVRNGRFLLYGLEVGGPYTLTVRRIGYVTQQRDSIFLTVGALPHIDVIMPPTAATLPAVRVTADNDLSRARSATHGGTATTIEEPLLQRLPTLNRDFYDFVRLVPQVSTKVGVGTGFSAGGVGFRYNNFLINGISERTLSGGVSPSFSGRPSVPLDAVQEYQVLLTPYDVRYGDFAGALVNTVTKAGTNELRGSAFGNYRNDRLARGRVSTTGTPYDLTQYGFAAAGPIIRDRLHFFVAPELRRFTFPALGPYVGQPGDAERPVPVAAADIERFQQIMEGYGLAAGSGVAVENANPLTSAFGRLDVALPQWGSRVIAWHNYSRGEQNAFSRADRDVFSLTSYAASSVSSSLATAVQLHTQLSRAGGGHNELLFAVTHSSLESHPAVRQPIVRVTVPATTGGFVALNAGTQEGAQASGFRTRSFAVKDAVTLPFSAHTVSAGVEAERFWLRRGGTAGSYGTWEFASLDALALGVADRYQRRLDFGSADVPIEGTQYAAYVSDDWQVFRRLSLVAGVRADLLDIESAPPYNSVIDSIFQRRTDHLPRRRIELSPRLGFVWRADVAARQQIRGGIGVFAVRPPLAWFHSALTSYGVGTGDLRCGPLATDRGPPPDFIADYLAAPSICAGGSEITAPLGDVNLLDRNLRLMRTLRGSLAYDRKLTQNVLVISEFLVTRGLSDLVFVNLNLGDSESTDIHGRVLYGNFLANGVAVPSLRSSFPEVIGLANTSRNRAYQVATRLEKRFESGSAASASYTYSWARDVQTPLRVNTRGTVTWASARPISGQHDHRELGISGDDIPHRVVLAGVYALPWRGATELSLIYVGESGRPFTYLTTGTGGRGDLNADGALGNDPVYVPLDVAEANEIRFGGTVDEVASQQSAFEARIAGSACLRRNRGRILPRNSCREPWSNTTAASIRQTLPLANRSLEVQLDAFNLLNLLNDEWGQRFTAAPQLLQHVGQTTAANGTSQPVFRFNTANPDFTLLPVESAFQLQLGVRYRF